MIRSIAGPQVGGRDAHDRNLGLATIAFLGHLVGPGAIANDHQFSTWRTR
ncbi:MAG: hypothetical protein ACT4O0_05355 [Pseudonocardia sp.]